MAQADMADNETKHTCLRPYGGGSGRALDRRDRVQKFPAARGANGVGGGEFVPPTAAASASALGIWIFGMSQF